MSDYNELVSKLPAEQKAEVGKFNRFLANWMINDMRGICKARKMTVDEMPEGTVWAMAYLVYIGDYTRATARKRAIEIINNRPNWPIKKVLAPSL